MFPNKIATHTMATALVILTAACATTPPENPQLTRLESDLKTAYADKYVAQYGQTDLARAEAALADARKSIRSGNDAETQHDLTMADGHIKLGQIHGRQEFTKAQIEALTVRQTQIRLESRDREIGRANEKVDAARADTRAAEQNVASMQEQLRMYDIKMNEMGATLVLRDVMFATNSAQLREGAINRLTPLINYLRSSPTTSVRIEGHTDSVGSSAHNETLSLNRANSVAQALRSNGQVTNPIQTVGMGESKPVASNDTVSGREQNRRVEITLLQ